MSDRTPGEWTACEPSSFEGRDGFVETPAYIKAVSASGSGERITRIIANIYDGDSDEGAANAAFIVRACNAHDQLLEAAHAIMDNVGQRKLEQLARAALEA